MDFVFCNFFFRVGFRYTVCTRTCVLVIYNKSHKSATNLFSIGAKANKVIIHSTVRRSKKMYHSVSVSLTTLHN